MSGLRGLPPSSHGSWWRFQGPERGGRTPPPASSSDPGSVCVSVFLSASGSLSVSHCLSLSVSPSISLSLSLPPSLSLSLHLCLSVSVSPSISLFLCLSFHLCLSLSLSLSLPPPPAQQSSLLQEPDVPGSISGLSLPASFLLRVASPILGAKVRVSTPAPTPCDPHRPSLDKLFRECQCGPHSGLVLGSRAGPSWLRWSPRESSSCGPAGRPGATVPRRPWPRGRPALWTHRWLPSLPAALSGRGPRFPPCRSAWPRLLVKAQRPHLLAGGAQETSGWWL